MPINIRWECQRCKNEGTSEEGYYIRCKKCGFETFCFKILEVYASIKIKKWTKK